MTETEIKSGGNDEASEQKGKKLCGRFLKPSIYTEALRSNKEAQAWAYSAAAQGVITGGGVLLTIPLLKLAEASAGCLDIPEGGECNNRVYGFKPSSLLTLMQTITGFVTAFLLPTLGGMIDSTSYRRGVAFWTGMFEVIVHIVLVIIDLDTWFICAIILLFTAIDYFVHTMVLYAYIPELSDDTETLTTLNSFFLIVRGFAPFPFYCLVGLSLYLMYGFDDVSSLEFNKNIARNATVIESVLLAGLYFKTFYKGLLPRPPKKMAAESPLQAFSHLKQTAIEIYTKYPALYWYLMALLPFANSVTALASVAVTFITIFLKGSTVEIGIIAVVFGFSGVIGSRIHPIIAKKVNLLNDVKINMCCWVILCVITGILVRGPEQKNLFIGLMSVFGIVFGWAIPSMRMLYFCLMPKGRETQFMGIYMLFTHGLVWLPPLLFTILNEAGMAMNWILMLGLVPFAIALLLFTKVGRFEDAVENVKKQAALDDAEEETNKTAEGESDVDIGNNSDASTKSDVA